MQAVTSISIFELTGGCMNQITRGLLAVASIVVLSAASAFAADPVKDQAKAAAADTKATAKKELKTGAVKAVETKTPAPVKVEAAKTAQIDINTASDAELKSIPGIGDVYATKIIAGRPYAKKDQLKSRNILPSTVYEQVKERIIAKQPAKKK